jgi:predicted small secreted protein
MHYSVIAALLLSVLLAACQTQKQAGTDARAIPANLVRVEHSSTRQAYVDPNADFSKFTAVLLTPLGVDNVEIVQPSATPITTGNPKWELTDADKQRLQQDFRDAMVKQLSTNGGYVLVDSPADNVMRISAILTRIAPTAPKDDNRSRPPGRNKVFTEGPGELRIEVTFSDATTGAVLALAKDRRSGPRIWGINNSVTNLAEVRRIFTAWAMRIRAQLDRLHHEE